METSIIKSGELQLPKFSLTEQGERWIQQALEGSALIAKVGDETENNTAVQAAQELKAVINTLEKSRVEITKPALEFQRGAKAFFDGKADEAGQEFHRLTMLVGSYASLQVAKARAAENARLAELSRLEKEREAALAQVKSHEERDVVQAHYNDRAAVEGVVPAPLITAKGQSVQADIEVTVVDLWMLARSHPSCVKIEPRMSEIKALLRAGVKVAGVTSKEVIKAGIRVTTGRVVDV